MDFSLNEEQKMMIATVRRFIAEELKPLEDEIEDKGCLDNAKAQAIHAKGKVLGLYGMNMPAELGGGGLSNLDRILCEEQFGHTTDILIRRAFGNVYEPLLHCKGEQVERWLKPAIEGRRTCAIAITESGAGSDAAGIKTHAKKTTVDGKDGWVLNGSKHFISDGEWSDFFLVSARTDNAAGEKEISMFMVDKGLPGFTVGKDQKMMGIRGTPHLELFFDNVPLEPVALLGAEGQGFKLAMGALNVVRLAQAGARAVGKASHVCELMVDYANDRKQFGQKIGDFQMVQQMLADSVIEINAARWMVYHAAWMLDQGMDAREQIAMVKVYAAETLGRVVDRAVNYGVGVPDAVAKLIASRGEQHRLYQTIEHGTYGGTLLDGVLFGYARNASAMLDAATQFDFYAGGGLDIAFLGFGEFDEQGSVNVSRLGGLTVGPGGFIDIAQNARKVVFCGTLAAKGVKLQTGDGQMRVLAQGGVKKLVKKVDQITFSGPQSLLRGQTVLYLTERASFRLTTQGIELFEIAPGIDLQRDVLAQMDFAPRVAADVAVMPVRHFMAGDR